MKTTEQKLEQVKRIMKKLHKRGVNRENINTRYRELLHESQLPGADGTVFKIVLSEKWVDRDDLTLGQLMEGASSGLWEQIGEGVKRPYKKICTCPCHNPGVTILHCRPCC